MKKILLTFGFILFISTQLLALEKIPELNRQIVEYVKTVIGKKVDRGECWDLANQALQKVDADWDRSFVYGNPVDPEKDEIFPGDIIQFENVVIKYKKENAYYTETMGQHTAIVYKVKKEGVYEIAHQNTQFSGRKVGISTLDINTVVDGKMYFYRPTKKRSSHE
ncbi:MAG TPA: hypothetical protein VJ896_11345 [Bacteroidales bacterium]|nr:hypothetical protein [Bacteroidales bacterium]